MLTATLFRQMLFSTEGRVTRARYWKWYLGLTFSLLSIFAILAVSFNKFSEGGEIAKLSFMLTSCFLYALHFIGAICIAAKRCHDRDRSAWFLLIGLVPAIGGLILLLDLGCKDGTLGPNRFGPSPKGIVGNEVASTFS